MEWCALTHANSNGADQGRTRAFCRGDSALHLRFDLHCSLERMCILRNAAMHAEVMPFGHNDAVPELLCAHEDRRGTPDARRVREIRAARRAQHLPIEILR